MSLCPFGWPVQKRSTTITLSPLPSSLKDVSRFSLTRTLNAPSRVDGKHSTGMVLDFMGKKERKFADSSIEVRPDSSREISQVGERKSESEGERQRQRDRQRERETDRETERVREKCSDDKWCDSKNTKKLRVNYSALVRCVRPRATRCTRSLSCTRRMRENGGEREGWG